MGEHSQEKKLGCGILNAVFRKRNKRSATVDSLTVQNNEVISTSSNTKKGPSGSDEPSFLDSSVNGPEANPKPCTKQPPNHIKSAEVYQQNQVPKPLEEETKIKHNQASMNPGRKLIRASSSNMMLQGSLGNLRQPGGGGGGGNMTSYNVPKTETEDSTRNGKYPNGVKGNVVKKHNEEKRAERQPASLCRALSTRIDPKQ